MKQINFMKKATSDIYKTCFKIKKRSPEILLITGLVGTVVGAVMACRETTKLSKIMERSAKELEDVREAAADENLIEMYTKEDEKKDTVIIYGKAVREIVKLYTPSVIVGGLSIASILASHNVLKKRNVAISAAYATISQCFTNYRNNVVERFGTEVDNELRYNLKTKKVKEKVIDENGREQKVKKNIKVASKLGDSEYARFFDESNPNWEKNGDFNMMFIRQNQQLANDMLRAHGYLFLNEVYKMLGFPQTTAGQAVGWIYNESDDAVGDNWVDFGITELATEAYENQDEEPERTILLDFNVDGLIMDKFEDFDTTR